MRYKVQKEEGGPLFYVDDEPEPWAIIDASGEAEAIEEMRSFIGIPDWVPLVAEPV